MGLLGRRRRRGGVALVLALALLAALDLALSLALPRGLELARVPGTPPSLALPAGVWRGPASLGGTPAAPRGRQLAIATLAANLIHTSL